jgi:glycosyltransferase involved in cell wall biosynthesis
MNAVRFQSSFPETLFLGLRSGKNYGWGICSRYLIKELSALTAVHVLNEEDGSTNHGTLPGKLFQALTNEHFYPLHKNARGIQNFGYTFFENELSDTSVKNAQCYDRVLAGSTWCRDRMLEKGIENCGVLLQGIDPQRFHPLNPKTDTDRFVIFSGGKFELRKGQDLVLQALKIVQARYADIVLVNCWYNLWPQTIALMNTSSHIRLNGLDTRNWTRFMEHIYTINGLSSERIKTLELVPSDILREIYRQTDIGLFPNRCEGGTNLVLMEYMACGRPVIATNGSGHMDVVNTDNALLLQDLKKFHLVNQKKQLLARWQEPSLDEIVDRIEYAYLHRDRIQQIGQRAGEHMKGFTWKKSARSLMHSLGING